jgi:hypothetical protein
MPRNLNDDDLYALWQFADGNCSENREAFCILIRLVDDIADALLARAVHKIARVEQRRTFLRMQGQLMSNN